MAKLGGAQFNREDDNPKTPAKLDVMAPAMSYAKLASGTWIVGLLQRAAGESEEYVAHGVFIDNHGDVAQHGHILWAQGG